MLAIAAPNAEAQRGDPLAYTADETPRPERVDAGFPGLFNAATMRRGSFELSGPFLALGYGVTDRFSVDLGLIQTASALISRPQRIAIGARYALWRSPTWSVVVDARTSTLMWDTRDQRLRIANELVWKMAMVSADWAVSPRQTLGASAGYLSVVGRRRLASLAGAEAQAGLQGFTAALTYRGYLTHWLGAEITAGWIADGDLLVDVTGEFITKSLPNSPAPRYYRALLQVRPSPNWLVNVGAVVVPALAGNGPTALPWVSVARRWL